MSPNRLLVLVAPLAVATVLSGCASKDAATTTTRAVSSTSTSTSTSTTLDGSGAANGSGGAPDSAVPLVAAPAEVKAAVADYFSALTAGDSAEVWDQLSARCQAHHRDLDTFSTYFAEQQAGLRVMAELLGKPIDLSELRLDDDRSRAQLGDGRVEVWAAIVEPGGELFVDPTVTNPVTWLHEEGFWRVTECVPDPAELLADDVG